VCVSTTGRAVLEGGEEAPCPAAQLDTGAMRATALLAVSTLIVIGSGIATAKIAAVLIGPAGLGQLTVAQGVVNVVAIVACVGVNAGLVRLTASEIGRGEGGWASENSFIAAVVTLLGSNLVLAASVLLAHPLRTLLFDGELSDHGMTVVVVSGVLYAWTTLVLSLATAQRMTELFVIGTSIGAITTPLVSAIGYRWMGADGVPTVLLLSNIGSLLAAAAVMPHLPGPIGRRRTGEAGRIAARLLRYGGPQAAGTLAATSSLLIVPVLVQRELGAGATGLFRAGFTMSAGYGALVGYLVAQDFFPRVSAATHDRAAFSAVTNRYLRLVATIATLVFIVGGSLSPVVVRLLFSSAFADATAVFRWQLAGEFLRLGGLTLATALSAYCGSGPAMGLSFLGAGAAVVGTTPALDRWALPGAGVAYFGSQALYVVLASTLVGRRTPFRPDRATLVLLGLHAAAVTAAVAVQVSDVSSTAVGLTSAALAAGVAVVTLRRLPAPERVALIAVARGAALRFGRRRSASASGGPAVPTGRRGR
jgi:PST family polysaccharide transporter